MSRKRGVAPFETNFLVSEPTGPLRPHGSVCAHGSECLSGMCFPRPDGRPICTAGCSDLPADQTVGWGIAHVEDATDSALCLSQPADIDSPLHSSYYYACVPPPDTYSDSDGTPGNNPQGAQCRFAGDCEDDGPQAGICIRTGAGPGICVDYFWPGSEEAPCPAGFRMHRHFDDGPYCLPCWHDTLVCIPVAMSCQSNQADSTCNKLNGGQGVWGWTATSATDPNGTWRCCTTPWQRTSPESHTGTPAAGCD